MLEQYGYREIRSARRGKEGPVLTARKREGLVDLRYSIRLIRGNRDLNSRDVEEVRRDIPHFGAQLGMIMCAGDASRDARQEVTSSVAPLVILLCGDALAERCMEKRLGSTTTSIEVYDLDEEFFRRCRERGAQEEREREVRRKEKGETEEREGREERPPREDRPPREPREPRESRHDGNGSSQEQGRPRTEHRRGGHQRRGAGGGADPQHARVRDAAHPAGNQDPARQRR